MTNAAALQRRVVNPNNGPQPSLPPLAREASALLDLAAVSRRIAPGREIISEGKPCTAVFLITEGIAIRYRTLRGGRRHILNFVFPGDFAGTINCRFETALHTVRAVTYLRVSPIPVPKLIAFIESHPRFAVNLLWWLSSESTILAEHLITLGRRSAEERVAHFLLEMLTRFQDLGLTNQQSFWLPATQEMISDALGLSLHYLNRVLQQFRREGLLTIRNRIVKIEKIEELSALADFEVRYLRPLSVKHLLGDTVSRSPGGNAEDFSAAAVRSLAGAH
jgi:CRP-like cAMP-binding protein